MPGNAVTMLIDFFRLKELKKQKKVELRRSLLYRKWQALRGFVGRRKQKKQNNKKKVCEGLEVIPLLHVLSCLPIFCRHFT